MSMVFRALQTYTLTDNQGNPVPQLDPFGKPVVDANDDPAYMTGQDWTFGQGISNYLTDEKAIQLNIATAFRCFFGDAFWNTTFGIDWINLLGTKNTQATIQLQATNLLSSCYGVVQVNSVSTNLVGRNLSLTYNISTIYSYSVINSVNILS